MLPDDLVRGDRPDAPNSTSNPLSPSRGIEFGFEVGYHSGGWGRWWTPTCSCTGSAAGLRKIPVSSATTSAGNISSNRAAPSAGVSPNNATSIGDEPLPIPISNRPRLSWSSIAVSCTSHSGS